jgi:hypothetical protein
MEPKQTDCTGSLIVVAYGGKWTYGASKTLPGRASGLSVRTYSCRRGIRVKSRLLRAAAWCVGDACASGCTSLPLISQASSAIPALPINI